MIKVVFLCILAPVNVSNFLSILKASLHPLPPVHMISVTSLSTAQNHPPKYCGAWVQWCRTDSCRVKISLAMSFFACKKNYLCVSMDANMPKIPSDINKEIKACILRCINMNISQKYREIYSSPHRWLICLQCRILVKLPLVSWKHPLKLKLHVLESLPIDVVRLYTVWVQGLYLLMRSEVPVPQITILWYSQAH